MMGHEFIIAINTKEIWEIIKKDFKECSFKTIFKVAIKLADGFANKTIQKLLDEE